MRVPKKIIQQQIIATVVILFMFIMVFGLLEKRQMHIAGTNSVITLTLEIVAGTLSIESPTSLTFDNILVGEPTNALANLKVVNVLDTRGGSQGWAVTGVMDDMYTSASGVNNNISNAIVAWVPGEFIGVNGSNTDGLATGAIGFFDEERTLLSAPQGKGQGAYQIFNTVLNIVYNGLLTQEAGIYHGVLVLTVQ